jgi:hypothetical protein
MPPASSRSPIVSANGRWHEPPGASGVAGTSPAQARRMRAGDRPWSLRRPRDGDRNGTRSASSKDHGGLAGHRQRRTWARACHSGVSRGGPAISGPVRRPAARGGTGGDDRLAVRHRGTARHRRRRASGRAGRDRGAARPQEARQDRPRRRAPLARVVDDRPVARVVDPTGPPARSARQGPAASHAGQPARRVAAAHPGGALLPRPAAAPRAVCAPTPSARAAVGR